MGGRLYAECAAGLGRKAAGCARAAALAGGVALLLACVSGAAQAALGTLAAAWVILAGLAAGGVAFSAAIRCSNGRWALLALPVAEATAGFFPAAVIILGILVLAAPAWIPGALAAGWAPWASRAARDLAAAVLLVVAARRYLGRPGSNIPAHVKASRAAIIYLVLFVASLSLWTVDLVMDLHDWAPSTVIPPFVFMSGLLAGVAWTAFVVATQAGVDNRTRHDLGKLLFAFAIVWGYLLWAEYLAVWYGNLPDEAGQLLARWAHYWKFVSLVVVGAVLVFPFFFLLSERTKRGRVTLGVASASMLVGLVGEGVLLVLPSLELVWGWQTLACVIFVTLGAAGLFVLTVGARLARSLPLTPAGDGTHP